VTSDDTGAEARPALTVVHGGEPTPEEVAALLRDDDDDDDSDD